LQAYALAADGQTLLVLHADESGPPDRRNSYVTVHDTATDRQVTRFTLPGVYLFWNQSPFSPGGRWLAFAGKVYHVRTGTELFAPAGGNGKRLAAGSRPAPAPTWFSADGRLLAGRLLDTTDEEGPTDTLAVWELASGRVLARFPNAKLVAQVAFAPDDRTIALVDGRGAHIHDLLTGRRLADFLAPDITCETGRRGACPQTAVFSPDGRQLATGHRDGSVLLWAVPRPPEARAEDVWSGLGDRSPVAARAAIDRAVRDAAAFRVLAGKFRAPADEPDRRVAALVADLDSDVYATREGASKQLRELGAKAEPALRRALAAARSPEARRRLEELVTALPPAVETLPVSGETLRGVRAVEALERVGTAEARALLRGWAEQGRDPRVAAEARFALGRSK
jgi:WD domain, G-beta repeat